MLGNGAAAAGTPRHSSPFPPHQGSMEALALLQASQPTTLPPHLSCNGVAHSMPLPRPTANAFGMAEAHAGEVGKASHAKLLAAGAGGLAAGPRRMSLDSAMPPRPPPPLHMRGGTNGAQPWPSEGMNGGAVDPLMLAALQLSQRAMAMPPPSGRSSMDGPHPGDQPRTSPVSLPQLAPGFIDNASYQMPRARGSLDLPPSGRRGLPEQHSAAGHDFGWSAAPRALPQRRSVDLGSVQRQGHSPLGGEYGMHLHPAHLLSAASYLSSLDGRADGGSPAPLDRASPLLPVSAAMAAHEHLLATSANAATRFLDPVQGAHNIVRSLRRCYALRPCTLSGLSPVTM